MELYLNIIKLFVEDKELYLKYKDVVDKEFLRKNSPELLKFFYVLDVLHKKLEGNGSIGDLEALFYAEYPASKDEVFVQIIKSIASANASKASIDEYLRSARDRANATQLAMMALDVAEGRKPPEELTPLLSSWNREEDNLDDEKYFVSDDLEVLYQHYQEKPGLNWRLKSLRKSIGPLRKGNFGFIFARPETGKTTLLASEFTYMARQADGLCVWFNNEEEGEQVMWRLYSASLGATREQLEANVQKARETFYARTNRRIRFVDNPGLDRAYVERLCRKLRPQLIVVDQLDKVKGFDGEREDLRMGSIYQWARELSKEYCPVIGVSQSDGSGEGVKYLNMGNVANAKTAKQAEADWILGVGLDYNDPPWVRGFSVCKNKLPGGPERVERLRHGHWDVLIQPEIARYKDMGEENGDD